MDWKRRAALQKKEDALRAAEGYVPEPENPEDLLPLSLRKPKDGGEWKTVTFEEIMAQIQPILDRHSNEQKGIKFQYSPEEKAQQKVHWRSQIQ